MADCRIYLPGATDAVIKREMFSVVEQFCSNSNIWVLKYPFETIAGETRYQVAAANSRIVRLMALLDENDRYPINGAMENIGEILLRETPSGVTTYNAYLSLTVDDPVNVDGYPMFPDWLLNRFAQTLRDGIVGAAMLQSGKPYSDPRMGAIRTRMFSSVMASAKTEANRKYKYGGQPWVFPQTFNRRRTQ